MRLRSTLLVVALAVSAETVSGQVVLDKTILQTAMPSSGALITIRVADTTGIQVNDVAFVDREGLFVTGVHGKNITVSRGYGGSRIEAHAPGALMYVGPAALFYTMPPPMDASCTGAPVTPYIDLANGAVYECIADGWALVTQASTLIQAQMLGGGNGAFSLAGTDEGVLGMSSLDSLRLRSSLGPPVSGLVDGDWWVECTGTSPTRVCALMVRDGGQTRPIAFITY